MDISGYISSFIKASEVTEGDYIVFLDEGEIRKNEKFDSDQLVLHCEYKGQTREITVNKTNSETLAEKWTTNTKAWVGKTAILSVGKVNVRGEMKDTIIMQPMVDGVKGGK